MAEDLNHIKLSDYKERSESYLRWRKPTDEAPRDFIEKFDDFPRHATVFQLLMRIRKVIYDLHGDKRDYAKSFADSRFTPMQEMLERGMLSCGAITAIYGSVLREFHIPTKFVHGKIKGSGPNDRHAWLKIYDPHSNQWINLDPGTDNFSTLPDARQWKVYYDWNELKRDYEKGEY